MNVDETIRSAELELLRPPTRHSAARLRELLHPDFIEIGRSGRIWTRDEVIASLAVEPDRPAPVARDWAFARLAPHLVLVTYRLCGGAMQSRHSSVWDTSTDPPSVRFHQGTVIPPE